MTNYDLEKWGKIINLTLQNQSNMIKRLRKSEQFSNTILIYYSIFLIVNTLTLRYFGNYYSNLLSEYFSVVISIILLVYTLINKNAKYSQRIDSILKVINELKTLKRIINSDNLAEITEKYNDLIDNTEQREDVDFFVTVKQRANKEGFTVRKLKNLDKELLSDSIKDLREYLFEINHLYEFTKIMFSILIRWFLYLLPVILFCVNILAKVVYN